MDIPFLNLFKRKKSANTVAEKPAAAAVAPLEKPSSERMSKTVMPNATRTVQPRDPYQGSTMAPSMPSAVSSPMAAARTIAFGGSVGTATVPTTRELPAAVALALEPKVERVISLDLDDVISHLPAGLTKPLEADAGVRRILFKASEVEKGMSNGKPSVSLASIYQQVPEIFLRDVSPNDATQVQLPFSKVLDQFTSLHVRGDQERAQSVPQVQTPFLQVTLEDDTRFGTTTEITAAEDLPPVRVQPATAETIAAAEPEPLIRETTPRSASSDVAPVRISIPTESRSNGASSNGAAKATSPQPARIPFKLAPNGTDAPAPESVPASSGPSVPNSSPTQSSPARIPFKIPAPSEAARPKPEPWLTAESFGIPLKSESSPVVASADKTTVSLLLKPILKTLPPFQLSGDISDVLDDARIELPFAIVAPQLATGRVSLTPKDFQDALPAAYRELFVVEDSAPNVSLPLEEVLKNLPSATLQMRADQEEQEAGSNFATPFSAKAEEDAKLFSVASGPIAKPIAPPVETQPSVAETAAALMRSPLQTALGTEEEVDAKTAVAHISKIAGVQGCALMFSDGLSLAGSLPEESALEGLSAMAPSLMQRATDQVRETKLGSLASLTFSCAKGSVTFCSEENLSLLVLHDEGSLDGEIRQRLTLVVRELSKKYSHPV